MKLSSLGSKYFLGECISANPEFREKTEPSMQLKPLCGCVWGVHVIIGVKDKKSFRGKKTVLCSALRKCAIY